MILEQPRDPINILINKNRSIAAEKTSTPLNFQFMHIIFFIHENFITTFNTRNIGY